MSYLKTKKGSLENSILNVWSEAAKKVDEKLVGGQKKLDKDKDGDIDAKDFAALRKSKEKKEGAKPDFLDIDKDGNKKEPMKKAAKDKEKMKESSYYNLQRAKELAKKDGLDYDRLPKYDRRHDKHKEYYDDKAKNESVKKENYEVGTKARRDHTLGVTPGQSPEEFEQQVSIMHKKKNSMREALAKMWGIEEKNNKNPFDNGKEKKNNGKKEGRTMTGQPETKVEVEPEVNHKKK